MYRIMRFGQEMDRTLLGLFEELGEPEQALRPDSPRPLVVHHEMSQLTYVASGTGRISLNADEFRIRPGDLMVLAPHCPHAFAADEVLVLRHYHWPSALLSSDRVVVAEHYEFGRDGRPISEDEAGANER